MKDLIYMYTQHCIRIRYQYIIIYYVYKFTVYLQELIRIIILLLFKMKYDKIVKINYKMFV